MSKYEDAAAKALREAKNDCQHRPENRGVDLDTGDDFCVDCGALIHEYEPRTPRRFPGREALDLVTPLLKEEFPDRMGQVRLHYVEPVADDEFNALIAVTVKGRTEFRQYRIVREDEGTTAVRMAKP